MSCAQGCAYTICLLFSLLLDWLSSTFLQEYFGCVVQAERWSLCHKTRDIYFGKKKKISHSNMCFAKKITETLQSTGLGFPVPS